MEKLSKTLWVATVQRIVSYFFDYFRPILYSCNCVFCVPVNEKTGLLGQRVVTSQVREEFPPSPTRDLYRALSPGYSPTGDLEWQDEFDFDVESGDQGFKQMLLPKLQLLQNQLINEFYDADKIETKKKLLLEGKVGFSNVTLD